MPILDYILYFAFGVVLYYIGKSILKSYLIHKVNMKIVGLYIEIPSLNRTECREALELLDKSEKAGAELRFIETARLLIEVQKEVLDAQNTIKDGL